MGKCQRKLSKETIFSKDFISKKFFALNSKDNYIEAIETILPLLVRLLENPIKEENFKFINFSGVNSGILINFSQMPLSFKLVLDFSIYSFLTDDDLKTLREKQGIKKEKIMELKQTMTNEKNKNCFSKPNFVENYCTKSIIF